MTRLVYLLGTLGIAVLSAVDPKWAVLGMAAVLPMTQSFDTGVPGANPINLVTAAFAVGLVLNRRSARAGSRGRFPVTAPLLMFLALVLLGWINAVFVQRVPAADLLHRFTPYQSFLQLKEIWTLALIMLLTFYAARTPAAVRRCLTLLVAGMSVEVLFCLLEWARKHGRITGHLRQANSMAAFLGLAAVMAAALFMTTRTRGRWWYFMLSAAASFACLQTLSRGGLLALCGGLLVLALLWNRWLFVSLVVLLASYQAWVPEVVLRRFEQAYVVNAEGELEAADTAAQRLAIWRAGLRMIADHPLGVGLGTFANFSAGYGLEDTLSHPDKNAHNSYLAVAAELSPLGLLAFLWLLLALARSAWRSYFRGDRIGLRPVGAVGLAAMIGIAAPSFVGTVFFQAVVAGHFWMVMGLVCRADCLSREHRSEPEGVDEGQAPRRRSAAHGAGRERCAA